MPKVNFLDTGFKGSSILCCETVTAVLLIFDGSEARMCK